MSCDGDAIYIADLGGENGAILTVPSGGGAASDLGATGIIAPGGLAMGPDCKKLYATGRTTDGRPGLFTLATARWRRVARLRGRAAGLADGPPRR